jgi:hypothetical protein
LSGRSEKSRVSPSIRIRVAADIEILDPAHDEARHIVDIGEVKDVFARPAAHMMAMGEARNGGEIENLIQIKLTQPKGDYC